MSDEIELIESNTSSANRLLAREASDDYIQEWTNLLMREKTNERSQEEGSVVVFRLGAEWLALSTHVVAGIAESRTIHTIPCRSNHILSGIVNMRGQLKLCIKMHAFLEIPELALREKAILAYPRMMAIQSGEDYWIFMCDEVFGIHHCTLEEIENAPVTVQKSSANYLKGMIRWNDKSVGYLNEDLLFYSLRRTLL